MNNNHQNMHNPSDDLLDQLNLAVQNQDQRTYRDLFDHTNWEVASADLLDKAIGITLREFDK